MPEVFTMEQLLDFVFKIYAPFLTMVGMLVRVGAHLSDIREGCSIERASNTSPVKFRVEIIIAPLKNIFFKIPFPLAPVFIRGYPI